MGIAEDYSWKSAMLRVTQVVVATVAASLLLGVFWPAAAGVVFRLVWLFALLILTHALGPAAGFWDKMSVLAGVPVAIVVGWIIDQVLPSGSWPGWVDRLVFVAAALVYCLAMSRVIQLRVDRRRARSTPLVR